MPTQFDERHFSAYFGDTWDFDTANRCLLTLDDAMKRGFRTPLEFHPGMTGLLAWRRLSGEGWMPLPIDLQTLIRETTGQGRHECCPIVDPIPDLYCLDLRLAYLASAISAKGGKEWRHEERPAQGWWSSIDGPLGFLGYLPARYRVRFQVPADWAHVGLLPHHDRRGWVWKACPGSEWDTWADAAEVRLAIECGWEVEILERLVCVDDVKSEQRPLRPWAEKLWRLYGKPLGSEKLATLWRTAIRRICLQAIGLFAYRPRTVTKRVTTRAEMETHDLAEETYRTTDEGEIEFEDYAITGLDHLMHPEFAATVWADTRVRLLRQRTQQRVQNPNGTVDSVPYVTGALTLPREQVVGFGLDALYLTHDPNWPDDGRPGRYRLKAHVPGPIPAPKDRRALEELAGAG